MSTKTREGVEVKVGQVWEDLDKRMDGRKVMVIVVSEEKGRAWVQGWTHYHGTIGRVTQLSIRRMHKHSTGWKLIKEP